MVWATGKDAPLGASLGRCSRHVQLGGGLGEDPGLGGGIISPLLELLPQPVVEWNSKSVSSLHFLMLRLVQMLALLAMLCQLIMLKEYATVC